ncbi:MAG: oligosaccharide flippase family protein [Methanolinea sp.]|nr:oligosaccharide flippase family protein [Methanolinea sp.]
MTGPASLVRRLLGVEEIRRHALLSFLASTGVTAVGYLSTVYIAHVAGAGVLGAYYLFSAYYSIAALVSDGGLGGAAVRKISGGGDEGAFFTAQAVARLFLTCLCMTGILVLAAPFMHDARSAGLIPWLVAALAIGSVSGILASGIYGHGSVGILQAGEFISTVTRVTVQILAVGAGFAVAGMAGGFIAGLLAAVAINARFLRIRPAAFGLHHLKEMIPDAAWGFSSSLASVLALYADTVIVGYFLDPTGVGYYRTPLQLATLSLFVATSLSVSLFPRLSSWYGQGGTAAIRHALERALSYSLVLAVPVICGGLVLGERLLYFLYGSPFIVATHAFTLLLLAQIGAVIFVLDSMALSAVGKSRTVFLINALSCASLILLEMIMVPAYGITGAAAAVLLVSIFRAFSSRLALFRFTGVRAERATVGHIALAGLLMGGFVSVLQWLFFPTHIAVLAGIVLSGALFYFVLLFRLERELRKEVMELAEHLGLAGLPFP